MKFKKSLNTNISSLTANDLAVYKKMNKRVGQQKEEIVNQVGINEQAAAWLCSPSQWTNIVTVAKQIMQ